RVSGAVGTALLAVFLQRAIAARAPGQHGGLQRIATLPHGQHLHLAGSLADAFGRTFWIAAGLTAAAIIPALLLPTRPPAAPASHQESDTAEAYAVNARQQAWSDNAHKHPRGPRIHPGRQSGAYPEQPALKASAGSTSGQLTVLSFSLDGGPPRHTHSREDESIYLLADQLAVECHG